VLTLLLVLTSGTYDDRALTPWRRTVGLLVQRSRPWPHDEFARQHGVDATKL
tara:strand:- start:119 stop:274 length:156 start_codon:yes stop_codon:yes gene_type:complete